LGTALKPTGLEANLDTQISTVIKGILALVGTIFLCLTVYAGILWMTAQGNSEKVDKAKGIVTTAVAGLFITMAAYAITAFVTAKVGGVGDSAPQNIGCCQNSNANCYVVTDGVCQSGDTFNANNDCDQASGICRPI
jgi:hypothetical protein